MLEFLNSNPGLTNILIAGAIVLSAGVYVKFTKKLVIELKKLRDLQTEP